MKTSNIVGSLLLTLIGAQAQVASTPTSANQTTVPAPTPYQVVETGPHHRVWQWQTYEPMANGSAVAHIHKYTELATGLNYLNGSGQYVPTQEKIEAFSGGAIARLGQHQVIFANNLNTPGAIDQQTPDGKRLRSNVLGLLYFDPTTGEAVQIAQVQDSQGELISVNQVLYPNAFQGVNADVQYSYRRDGMEQDVILREQPAAPEAYGMNSATTELEVFTEFLTPPIASVADTASSEPGLEPDQTVNWGATSLGRGKAFSLGGEDTPAPVAKRYATVNGRHFLLEKVRLRDIQQSLAKLPEQASNARHLPGMASKNPVLPKAPTVKTVARPIRLALAPLPDKGFVLDYVSVNAAYTNYTFQGDTTYYLSSTLNLYGTSTFEGGTVIKYAANASITEVPAFFAPLVVFKSLQYLPVVFTAKDDNTAGENISGSTGTPNGYYANPAIYVPGAGTQQLADFRVSYAKAAISAPSTVLTVCNAQFVNCGSGLLVSGTNLVVNNALFINVATNFSLTGGGAGITANNVTFKNSFFLASPTNFPTGSYLQLTNCILASVTNVGGTVSAGYNGFYRTTMIGANPITNIFYPFQQVGAASCYLTNGCAFTNAGTSFVDPHDLNQLVTRTTHPPLVYSNTTLSGVMTFSPQALRDTNNTPDLGYHYDPLDFVFGGVNAYSNITFTAGTAVGYFELPGSGGAGYGLSIYDHVVVALNGTVSQPCTVARYSTVQEGSTSLWKDKGWLAAIVGQSLSGGYGMSASNAAQVSATFTRHAALSGDPNAYREYNALLKLVGNNSEFWVGNSGAYWMFFSITNCLFDRAGFSVQGSNPALCGMRNCTMHGGFITMDKYGGTWPVWVEDCAFDGTSLQLDDNSGGNTNITYCDFNAYLTNANQMPRQGVHVVVVTNYNWQTSWLGNYYQPTNSPLIDKGSTTADQFGLYHFTTQTSQMKETNSVVDIGYHYVALDALGNPIDTNGDGIPDYLEDANGDGIFDAGDLGEWKISPYGLGGTNALQVFTPLK